MSDDIRGMTAELAADPDSLVFLELGEALRRRGQPDAAFKVARTGLTEAAGGGADLIVLATHGKAGSQAFWAGSIAALVLEKTALPVLLVPVGEAR